MARLCAALGLLFSAFCVAHAQSSPPAPADANAAPSAAAPSITIHGVVRSAATGEPLPRVLVKVENGSLEAALTDGDGNFEIPGVPAGITAIEVTRPGFQDALAPSGASSAFTHSAAHAINVATEMPALEFAMRPLNAIRGQIALSTGEPGEGFRIELLQQSLLDGRLQWRVVANRPTSADGAFRFGGLSDGTYTVATQPSIDGDENSRVFQPGGKSPLVRTGYARIFYPDARDLSGAARIRVAGGQTAQANVTLKQEEFHLVKATVIGPGPGSPRLPDAVISTSGATTTILGNGVDPEVLDARGRRELAYRAEYDQKSRIVQAMLPDGDYTLRVIAFGPSRPFLNSLGGIVHQDKNLFAGQADVSVNGHAITNLRIALGPESSNVLEVLVNRTGDQAPQQQNENGINITASQAGADTADPLTTEFAQGIVPGMLETQPLGPGSYWLHTTISQPGLCVASFTAGGANLAHEPLVVAANGSVPPLTLTLRDDCASLRVSLPGQLAAASAGETPIFYVYVVPDFDSTTEVQARTLYPGQTNSFLADRLTPGAYRVYALRTAGDLPYRDPDAMAALNLQGQAVSLAPGETTDLVVEVPAP